jgi:hypothetical protein
MDLVDSLLSGNAIALGVDAADPAATRAFKAAIAKRWA